MNKENLHKIIDRYLENIELVNNKEHEEIFKWEAVENFRKIWTDDSLSFEEKMPTALNKCSLLLNDGRTAQGTGLIKVLEKDPAEVQRLFEDVLFANDNGDIRQRENQIDTFLVGIDKVLQKYFPQSWKYKQDRKSAITYLTLHSPDDNFLYKYSEVNEFATVIEYGIEIGSGANFSLEKYYDFCKIIRDALNEHQDLISKHQDLRGDGYYADKNNNILVFDLMYCARTYNFYNNLQHISKTQSIKNYTLNELRAKEEQIKKEKIENIDNQIRQLEVQTDAFNGISLEGIKVTFKGFGIGEVIIQNGTKIKVKFEKVEKTFVLNRQYSMRPSFDDDTEIVEIFSEYDDLMEKIKKLEREKLEIISG
ncbi:MAG: hypothetical protein R3Y09_01245 [Clostridia bacterium]